MLVFVSVLVFVLTWFLMHLFAFMFQDGFLSHIQFECILYVHICFGSSSSASWTKSSESDTATSMAFAGTPWRLAEAQAHPADKAAQAIAAIYEKAIDDKANMDELTFVRNYQFQAIDDKANMDKKKAMANMDKTHGGEHGQDKHDGEHGQDTFAKIAQDAGETRLQTAIKNAKEMRAVKKLDTHAGVDKIALKISHIKKANKIEAIRKQATKVANTMQQANKIEAKRDPPPLTPKPKWASKVVPHTANCLKTGSDGQPLSDGCDASTHSKTCMGAGPDCIPTYSLQPICSIWRFKL